MRVEAAMDKASPPLCPTASHGESVSLLQARISCCLKHPHFYPTLVGLTPSDLCSSHKSGP